MTHNQWTLTSYNSFETETVLAAQPWHVWINPRQAYCDRGHWDWGNSGSGPAGLSPEPSYYFMSLDTALLELEEYVWRSTTGNASPAPSRALPAFDAAAWVFRSKENAYYHMRNTAQGSVIVTVTEEESALGNVWVAEVEGIDSLDSADMFPRVYYHKEAALSEMERFLRWRLEHTPFESATEQARRTQDMMDTQGEDPRLKFGAHLESLVTKPSEGKPKKKITVV